MATTQPIRSKKQLHELTAYYLKLGKIRNHVLIVISLHTALRISDVLRLTWDNVYDFKTKSVKKSLTIIEKKTGKPKTIALHKSIINAISLYSAMAASRGQFLILNPKTTKAIGRIQAYRLIRSAAEAVGIEARVSCHSLRKSFGYHSWKQGISLAVLMDIYNHSSFAVTLRYLGVSQDDKDSAYLKLRLTA